MVRAIKPVVCTLTLTGPRCLKPLRYLALVSFKVAVEAKAFYLEVADEERFDRPIDPIEWVTRSSRSNSCSSRTGEFVKANCYIRGICPGRFQNEIETHHFVVCTRKVNRCTIPHAVQHASGQVSRVKRSAQFILRHLVPPFVCPQATDVRASSVSSMGQCESDGETENVSCPSLCNC